MAAMPKKNVNELRGGTKYRVWIRLAILLIGCILVFSGGYCLVAYCSRKLLQDNVRFALLPENIKVSSTGYWRIPENKDMFCDMVFKYMKDEVKDDAPVTIFSRPLWALRRRLLDNPVLSSISSVNIERELPGKLNISLVERVPRAYINTRDFYLVADDDAVLMYKNYCLLDDHNLPVIHTGRSWDLKDDSSQLKPVMELLKIVRLEHPEINVLRVDAYDKDKIIFVMTYCGGEKKYTVYMKNENFAWYLKQLSAACAQVVAENHTGDIINLLYDVGVTLQSSEQITVR